MIMNDYESCVMLCVSISLFYANSILGPTGISEEVGTSCLNGFIWCSIFDGMRVEGKHTNV